MKSSLNNYKEYAFPVRFLISYIIVSAIGIFLIDLFAAWLIISDATNGFFGTLLSVLFALVAYIVEIAVLGGILGLLCAGKKVYRGIGLYNFALAISLICPIVFVGMIILLNLTKTDFTFFNLVILLLECGFPICMMGFLRLNTHRCDNCGLIKTMNHWHTQTESLEKRVKYHNEGGYYKDVTTTGKATEVGSLTPETFDVTMTTRQYVPKTTVRDGQFEKRRTTTSYTCCVCGNIMKNVFENEHKIGD